MNTTIHGHKLVNYTLLKRRFNNKTDQDHIVVSLLYYKLINLLIMTSTNLRVDINLV